MAFQNFMNSVRLSAPKRNRFDLTHDRKFSMKMGLLYPCLVMDVIPGDQISLSTTQALRLAPMVAPIMHRVDVRVEYFYVPNRIVWPNFGKWISADASAPVFPTITIGKNPVGSIMDFAGVPTEPVTFGTDDLTISAIPFAAIGKIRNDYYRDQDLQPDLDNTLSDGDNTALMAANGNLYDPFPRCWEKDVFTSARPWTQKGNPALVPLGTTAPLVNDPNAASILKPVTGGSSPAGAPSLDGADHLSDPNGIDLNIDITSHTVVDLTTALAATVNDVRTAFRIQEWLERNAVAGTRYNEFVLAHFGVRTKDASLQRPQFLGSLKSPMSISEVLQTSETTVDSPQGSYAGHGISYGKSRAINHYCDEHGYIIGFISVIPRTAYMQGLPRHFSKIESPYDFADPIFAHLGEQPIRHDELFIEGSNSKRKEVFGYNRRYYEYCQMPSSVHGEFRTTQDFWHMANNYSGMPSLNSDFVSCNPTTRIFADTSPATDKLYCHMLHELSALRPLPMYGTPTI